MDLAVTAIQFRTDFPEFSDTVAYPDAQVDAWLSIDTLMCSTGRWGLTPGPDGRSMFQYGVELLTAHNLTLERGAMERAGVVYNPVSGTFVVSAPGAGGPPGAQTGAIQSLGAGGASISYDTGIAAGTGNSQNELNLTLYGLRFRRLADMVGAGPVQIGLGSYPPGHWTTSSAFAYSGPWTFSIPNPVL